MKLSQNETFKRLMNRSTRLWLGMTAPLFFVPFALAVPSGEIYQITAGDTLSQIAESRYGNWVKWHDLYSVNRDMITNPDEIYPGQRLRLLSEDEISFFREKNGDVASNGNTPYRTRSSRRSNEWRLLPTQAWERYVFKTSPVIDPQGFDRRSKVAIRVANQANAEATIASDRLAIYGEIVNARTEYTQVFLGEQVFVRADEELQVGSTYSVTSGPQKLSSVRDGRVGFAYDVLGRVRIVGVRDGLFIGTVTTLYSPIKRHDLLIPVVKAYPLPNAVAAPAALNATVMVTDRVKDEMIGEQKLVFLDVGSFDGVKPGMIFRNYLHRDPNTNEEISTKDFLIESELQVVDVQDKFSTALVIHSRSSMRPNDEVIALTDLSDYRKNTGMQTLIQDHTATSFDELDTIDDSQGLGEKENHELRQLENWNSPSPEGTLEPTLDNDEIKREQLNPNTKNIDLGHEPAPNDASNVAPVPPTAEPTVEPSAQPGDIISEPAPTEPVPADSAPAPEPAPEPTPDATTETIPEAVPVESVAPTAPDADLSIPADSVPPETIIEGSSTDPFAEPTPTP
jgi:hypothetical protein